MLVSLTIQNIVLIEKLCINFADGFNALTGETGAGKSIMLDSLGLALGDRADAGLVRQGTNQGTVTALFQPESSHPAFRILEEQGLDHDGELILRRILGADGRSRAFINDQPVSAGLLREIGRLLVEIHGQFDTHGLLDAKTHLGMLDDYAGLDKSKLHATWQNWRQALKDYQTAKEEMEQAQKDELYLRQALEDLDALSPEAGEEDKLAALREKLMKREQVIEALNTIDHGIGEAESTVGGIFRAADGIGEDGAELAAALDRASAELQEASAQARDLFRLYDESDYSLQEIDDRLFALRGQARKHQCAVDDLPGLREKLAGQLNMIEAQDDVLSDLLKKTETAKADYRTEAEAISQKRHDAAQKLDSLVAKELPPLKLDKAKFQTLIETAADETQWNAEGIDSAQFVVATNPGAAPGPLNKIASGGELARFTLALKVILAAVGAAGSLIFDEVDTGIGGSTAAAVGERLARLSQSRQILVVTHSPQVAALAAHHFIVMKSGTDRVKTDVIPLPESAERREEIARMLSGVDITDEARQAADRLLETGT